MVKIKKSEKKKNHKGFSFLEVMLSVFLLTTGIMAAVSLIGSGIKQTLDSKNQQTAALLAEEGVELVRNIRDNNWATGAADSFLKIRPSGGGVKYCIDYRQNQVGTCPGSPKGLLNLDGNRFYVNSSGTPTQFSRQIFLSLQGSGTNETLSVTSAVTWGNKTIPIGAIDDTTCNTGKQCAFASVILTKWGGN